MNNVVDFSRFEFPTFVAHRLGSVALILQEHCADAFARSVRVELKGCIRASLGNDEDGIPLRSGDEGGFEGVEGVDGCRW